MKVDRRRARVRRDVVAAVHVHVHAVQVVDDLLEGVEVEGDEVIDLEPGQALHRDEGRGRAVVAAQRPGRVDAVGGGGSTGVAVDRHPHVAREREQRERVVGRIGSQQHQRVRVRACVGVRAGAGPVVVARDECNRRLRRDRGLEFGLRPLCRLVLRRDGGEALVPVEIQAARGARGDHNDREHEPSEAAQDGAGDRAAWWIWLPVPDDRPERRRQRRVAVAVEAVDPPDSALQRRPHTRDAPPRTRRSRIAQLPEVPVAAATGSGAAGS
jgi:hypothetical protein